MTNNEMPDEFMFIVRPKPTDEDVEQYSADMVQTILAESCKEFDFIRADLAHAPKAGDLSQPNALPYVPLSTDRNATPTTPKTKPRCAKCDNTGTWGGVDGHLMDCDCSTLAPDGGSLDALDAFKIVEDHLKMKDGSEFIWKEWEDAALYVLQLAKRAGQLQQDITVLSAFILTKDDDLRSKAHEIARKVSNE